MRTIDQIFLNIENQNFEMDNYRYFLSGRSLRVTVIITYTTLNIVEISILIIIF